MVNGPPGLPWATALSPPNVGFKEKGPLVCLFAAGQGPIGWVTFFSPTPSPCRSSGSSSFQRLKAKLLESLCFYPPICRHLAGQGGLWLCGGPQGAARTLAENQSFVLAQTALGFGMTPAGGQASGAGPAGRPVASLPTTARAPHPLELPVQPPSALSSTDSVCTVPATTFSKGSPALPIPLAPREGAQEEEPALTRGVPVVQRERARGRGAS